MRVSWNRVPGAIQYSLITYNETFFPRHHGTTRDTHKIIGGLRPQETHAIIVVAAAGFYFGLAQYVFTLESNGRYDYLM